MRPFNLIPATALALVLGAGVAAANDKKDDQKSMSNADFVKTLTIADLAEVEMGKLALEKSQSQDVKDFAQHMIDDHGKNSTDLANLAQSKSLKVPKDLDAKHRAKMAMLKAKSGASFDTAYSEEMLKDHKKDAAELKKASTAQGLDPDLKSFASQTLKTVEDHQRMASTLVASHGSSKSDKREAEADGSK
jgi:putative membrane protein